jgi:hypothetical protein
VGDPYREVVEGPVHRLALGARSSLWIRLGFPLVGLQLGACVIPMLLGQAQYADWPVGRTVLLVTLTVIASLVVGALMGRLLIPGAWKSRTIEIDRDRRVLRYQTPRGPTELGPPEMVVPFAAIVSLNAIEGGVYLRTEDGLVHALVDYNHRRPREEAEGIAKRIEELVVAETGAPLPRVRVAPVDEARDVDAEAEAESETEAEGWSERKARRR